VEGLAGQSEPEITAVRQGTQRPLAARKSGRPAALSTKRRQGEVAFEPWLEEERGRSRLSPGS
jgi:hypothetical protein